MSKSVSLSSPSHGVIVSRVRLDSMGREGRRGKTRQHPATWAVMPLRCLEIRGSVGSIPTFGIQVMAWPRYSLAACSSWPTCTT